MKLIVNPIFLLLVIASLEAQSPLMDDLFPWEDIDSFETKVEGLEGPKIHEYVSPLLPPGLRLYLHEVDRVHQ